MGAGGGPTPAPADDSLAPRARRLALLNGAFHVGTAAVAVGLLALAVAIGYVLVAGSTDSFSAFGLSFLAGLVWEPYPPTGPPVFGALPAIVGTLLTSGLALLLAVPVALGTAIYISELAPRRWREPLATVVDLSAAIPSVIYGLWGLLVVVPIMAEYVEPFLARITGARWLFSGTPLGLDVFTASIVLALMILPTISAFARAALSAVPRVQREAALSMGATRWETVRMAVLGPARLGIAAGILLGLGRAIAEAIVVTMLIGNEFIIPTSLLSPGQSMASMIASSILGASGLEVSALVELGLILLLMSLAINVVARWILRFWSPEHASSRAVAGKAHRSLHSARMRALANLGSGATPYTGAEFLPTPAGSPTRGPSWLGSPGGQAQRRRRRQIRFRGVQGATMAAVAISIAPLVAVVWTAIARGGRAVVTPGFYTQPSPPPCGPTSCVLGGIGPALEGTLILVGVASLIAVPLGILAGIYLSEFGRRRLGPTVSFVVDTLTGLPSILIGLFVFVVFVALAHNITFSAIAGIVGLSILMLPIVVRATEVALRQVSPELREAALALGFPRHRVALRVVFGTARAGVVVGVILAVARAGGETAALIMTAAGDPSVFFHGFGSPVAALPLLIFDNGLTSYPNWVEAAWGAALVLIAIMLAISIAARFTVRRSGGMAEVR